MTEIRFWEAKCMNLDSLYEQMRAPTTKNMASILDKTDRYKITWNFVVICGILWFCFWNLRLYLKICFEKLF